MPSDGPAAGDQHSPRPGSVGDVKASVELEDGRLSMSADVESELVFRTPENPPLSRGERHAVLRLYGSGLALTIELDGANVAALADEVADSPPVNQE